MYRHILITIIGIALVYSSYAQQDPPVQCGQKEITDKLLRENPVLKQYQEQVEKQLRQYQLARKAGPSQTQRTAAIVTLPVVVHIIHNNGTENITDAQVLTGIQHLNEAFANTGYYDPADGVNTQIQFCMAQRGPAGNATNGITRDVSAYTVMGGANYYSDDQAVKNLNRWNPSCYINIWLVRSIPGSVAGYAYLPAAHGSNLDGIVMEAAYFGSSPANDVVVIHEMGHFLGLYHTFEGACKNDDCTKDGDRVCDTPPDQSTAGVACSATMNSCSTDALSGFGTDVNDLKEDYMDYGNFNCMKVFTQGQTDRMNWHIQNIRSSLLNCKSCLTPCPAPVTAGFTASATSIGVGTNVTFTNSSVNGATYAWYLNNVLQASTTNHSYTFNTAGTYTIKLAAYSSSPLCDSAIKTEVITVTCPVTVQFSPGDTSIAVNNTLNFINTSTGATTYNWLVNGVSQGTTLNFSQLFTTAGNYRITLKADNGACGDSLTYTIVARDTCLPQPTFQKTYGGQLNDFASDVRATSDGGFIIAGRTNSFGVNDDGYLLKTDNLGVVKWSYIYSYGNGNDLFTRVIQTNDGGYIAVGQTKSFGFPTGAAWVVKTDAGGIVQWSKQYGEKTTNGEVVNNVIQTSDGGYALVCRHDAAPTTGNVMVIKLDAAGVVQWSKIYDNGDTDQGNTILEDNGGLIVTGYRRSSTYHDAFMMKLNPANGNPLWTNAYDIDGRNNFMGGVIEKQGTNYVVHLSTINDLTNANTSRDMILTIDMNGNAVNVKEIIAPDFMLAGSGAFVLTPDGGFITQHNEDNSSSDFNLFKFNSTGGVEWAKKYPRTGIQANYTLRATPDGGLISVGYHLTAGGNNDIYVVKTDGRGYTPGCDTAFVQVRIQTPAYTTLPFTWQTISNANFIAPLQIAVLANQVNTKSNALCTGSTCTITPPVDTCKTTTFIKVIGASSRESVTDIKTTADGDFIIAGGIAQHKAKPDRDGLLMKVNREGTILWQKAFGSDSTDIFRSLLITRDNNIVTLGQFNLQYFTDSLYQEFLVSKFDQQGTMLWSKRIQNQATGFEQIQSMHQMIETDDNGIVISFSSYASDKIYLAKLTKDGNLVWFKTIVAHNGLSSYKHFVTKGDMLIVSLVDDNIVGNAKSMILQINHKTGNPYSGLQLTSSEAPSFAILQLESTATGFTATGALTDQWATFYIPAIVQFDLTGKLVSSVSIPGLNKYYVPKMANNPSFMALTNLTRDTNMVFRITPEGLAKWSYKYAVPGSSQSLANITLSADAGVVVAGTVNSGLSTATDIYLIKTSQNGMAPSCLFQNAPLYTQPTALQTANYSFGAADYTNYQLDDIFYNQYPINLAVTNFCNASAGMCNQLKITGEDSTCNLTDTLDFMVDKNLGCGYSVDWSTDTNMVKIVAVTDTTIRLLPKKQGQVQLIATIKMPCSSLADTIDIVILHSSDSLNLGPDIQLCQISTYTLHAGPGFVSYEWQDGSADSTFTAYNPGEYHVLAKDYCGKPYRDTVKITQAPAIPFDLGTDLELCEHDTLTLTAPGGFTNYRWSANYKVNSPYGQSIKIFTDKDTLYSVIAEKSPGCLVIDTIRVKVKHTTPIKLGNDTSFCINNSLVLDAGPGFNSYTWSTGAGSQQITAATAGLYWVQAENPNGCISKDSVTINNVYSLPQVNLGKDTILCAGNTYVFEAGNGFAAYQWQNGATSSTFTASQTGMYWVKVTDSHTCTQADTAFITGIKALPSGYLADTVQVCDGQRVTIKALADFVKYQWYNSASAPAITVNSPGLYWLKVTDANGCTGLDTIEVVDKNCQKALYLPNAFTPNNDQNNDLFKPTVLGILEKFRLTVYNRWGEKIFETTNASRGWDGTYKGKMQDTNSFVYICQYKFIGTTQVEKTEKGIITLVR